jgi:cytidylate kinase
VRSGPPAPFITISRQAGAGGVTVADAVAARMNEGRETTTSTAWIVFDKNLARMVAEEHDLSEKIRRQLGQAAAAEIRNPLDDLLGVDPSSHRLVARTSWTILRLASLGSAIIVGRGGSVVTRKLPGGFHVRLIASPENRIAHIMQYEALSRARARAAMLEEDRARQSLMNYFDEDIDDPLLYDVVINTDHLTGEETARLIVHGLRGRERATIHPAGS